MKILFPLAVAAALGLVTGCQTTETGAFPPENTSRFDLENHSSFVLLDSMVQKSVTCSILQQQPLEDGRLKVTANIRNREGRRIQVQVNCVFKDANGFSAGDETPFQNLILSENAQESVSFTSMDNKAQKYTIRVRQAH